MKYVLEIERQSAAIEIRTTPPKLNIRSKRPSFTIKRTPAKLNIERKLPGAKPKSQDVPQQQYEPVDVLQLSKRFEGYNSGAEVVSRIASRHTGAANGPVAALDAAMQSGAAASNERAVGESISSDNWDPGYVKMNWDAHSIELQWDVHPLEIEYEPYSVEITMKNYPSLKIRAHAERTHNIGKRVDRRI